MVALRGRIGVGNGGFLGDLGLKVDDTEEDVLKIESGALGRVHLNYYQRPATHNLEISGTHGTIRWDNEEGTSRMYQACTQEWEAISSPESFKRNDLFLKG